MELKNAVCIVTGSASGEEAPTTRSAAPALRNCMKPAPTFAPGGVARDQGFSTLT